MPYYLRITYDGVGLHAGPIPRPGHPASHGCIRLPAKMAPVLFEHVGVGTKVSIVGNGPDYGNYAQKQRALAAERAAREKERREIEARAQAETLAGGPAAGTVDDGGPTDSPAPAVANASPSDTRKPAASPWRPSRSHRPTELPQPPRRPGKRSGEPPDPASCAPPAPATAAAAVATSRSTPPRPPQALRPKRRQPPPRALSHPRRPRPLPSLGGSQPRPHCGLGASRDHERPDPADLSAAAAPVATAPAEAPKAAPTEASAAPA